MNTRSFQRLEVLAAAMLFAVTAFADDVRLAPGSHTVLIESAARETPLRELKLREAGLKAAPVFQQADEIRVFSSKSATNASPLARIWINATQSNQYWFHTGGTGSAENFSIRAGNAVVIVTRGSTNPVVVPKP